MEPAALGKAVVAGPRMGDFRESVLALQRANAMVQLDAQRLAPAIRTLIDQPAERARLGHAAREVVRSMQGATERTAEALLGILEARRSARA
jgi:3-deoxy-D-manno-octulosonic-acid transferase